MSLKYFFRTLPSCFPVARWIKPSLISSGEPLNLPAPLPLSLQDVNWIIITKDNADEVFEKVKSSSGDYALFAVTDEGYEKLALNFAEIRNKLAEQRQIILSYKEYYEGDDK